MVTPHKLVLMTAAVVIFGFAGCSNVPVYETELNAPPVYDVEQAVKKIQESLGSANQVTVGINGTWYTGQRFDVAIPTTYRLLVAGPLMDNVKVLGTWAIQVPWRAINVGSPWQVIYPSNRTHLYLLGVQATNTLTFWWKSDDAGRQHAIDFANAMRSMAVHVNSGAIDSYRNTRIEQRMSKIRASRAPSTQAGFPEEVRKYHVKAQTAIKENRFIQALFYYEYGLSLDAGLWWPDGYFNSALIWEKLGLYPEAINHMKYYLAAAPDAPDARTAQDNIYEWEGRRDDEKMPYWTVVFTPASK